MVTVWFISRGALGHTISLSSVGARDWVAEVSCLCVPALTDWCLVKALDTQVSISGWQTWYLPYLMRRVKCCLWYSAGRGHLETPAWFLWDFFSGLIFFFYYFYSVSFWYKSHTMSIPAFLGPVSLAGESLNLRFGVPDTVGDCCYICIVDDR